MRAKLARWGHSLALRVPRHLAQEAGLNEGTVVELVARADGLDVTTVSASTPSLQDLVDRITDANRHSLADSGPAVGGEVW